MHLATTSSASVDALTYMNSDMKLQNTYITNTSHRRNETDDFYTENVEVFRPAI